MNLYSEKYCDPVSIRKQYHVEFCEQLKKSPKYDETKVNDLIYFAYDIYDTIIEMGYKTTKLRLLLIITDLIDFIPFDKLIELKAYEFKEFLTVTKDEYEKVYDDFPSQQ